MNLINKRYRIIKNINQNHMVSSYLVSDVMNNHETLQLNIINSELISNEILEYFIEEFPTIANIEMDNIIRIFDFGLIETIGNNKVSNNEYFYTNKYYSDEMNFYDYLEHIDKNNLLDGYLQLCRAINYLHLRGFVYGELNPKNVFINRENRVFKILLKDMLTIELEKQQYWIEPLDSTSFKAPEFVGINKPTIASDIYSLGIFLLLLCGINLDEDITLDKKIMYLKEKFNEESCFSDEDRYIYSNLIKIAENMIDDKPENRYKNIHEIVNDINRIFNKEYKACKKAEIEKLTLNSKICGRKQEIETIIKSYENLNTQKEGCKAIFVHGEQGIGKTRLLKELNYCLAMKRANVYSSFALQNSTMRSNKAIADILKRLVAHCEEEVLVRYQSELMKFIPELRERSNIPMIEALSGEKEKYRLISRIYRFIQECLRGKTAVFIIDNAQYLDDLSVELIEYLSTQMYKDGNIMIILSYNDGESVINTKFRQFVSKNIKNINIYLSCLNSEETALMIQRILNMPKTPTRFGARVYNKTYGNPLFIEETLKDFLAKRIIEVDEERGVWKTPYDSFNEIPIASSMEQALLNQVKEIDNENYELLTILSIFSSAVSAQVINKFFSYSEATLESYLNELSTKGILCKKIEDRGFVFDFYNKVLKNLIYNKLSDEEKRVRHQAAVAILEEVLEKEGRENKEELIYHLEKSGNRDKVVKYCIENAEKMEKFRIIDEAISNYEKALLMLSDTEEYEKRVELLFKIGDMCYSIGNISIALENYKKSYEYALKTLEEKLQVDALNKIAFMYVKKNELEKGLEFIRRSEEILNTIEYLDGYLENRRIYALVCLQKQENEKTIETCISCIKLCDNKNVKYEGYFYNALGNVYSFTGRTKESLEAYKKAKKCFQEINYVDGIVLILNNLGVLYGDFYQDNDSAIVYFNKMKEICEKNNIINSEVVALTNLSSCYLEDFDYEIALQYFEEALEKSKKTENENISFYIYNYLSFGYLKIGQYNKAYEYHLLAKQDFDQYPEQGRHEALYYQMTGELYFSFGEINAAYEFVNKAISAYDNDGSTQERDCKILKCYLEMFIEKTSEGLEKGIEDLKKLIDISIVKKVKTNISYDTCILLYDKGYKEEIGRFLEQNNEIMDISSDNIIRVKGLYLRGLIYKESSFKNLTEALELCKKLKNKAFQWRICIAIGDHYLARKNYFYAANYYFEACEIIKDITLQLPEDLRVCFVKNFNMLKPFNKIDEMKDRYNLNVEENESSISEDIDLNRLFNYENFHEILANKNFIKSAEKIYSAMLPEGIRNINDIILNMPDDPIKTLDNVSKLLSSMVLSTRSSIILEQQGKKHFVISSSDGKQYMPPIKKILEVVKETKKPMLISETSVHKSVLEQSLMPKGMKAVICIPILSNVHCYNSDRKKDSRNKKTFDVRSIKGYIYMESERILNNFNEESLNKCSELIAFISFVIENYHLKITSSIDKLTGALTRKFLEEALSQNIEKATWLQEVFSIVMFDLDNFKGINDRFGHQTGDEVLREVTKIVKDSIRKEDLCGRYGGEEFIIILPGTGTFKAIEIAERVRQNIENKKILGDKKDVTVSMGIATYPTHGKWKQELIEKADQALYVAKDMGKNRCQPWEEEFLGKVKGSNKLSGIVSGNAVQDSRNVLAMIDLIELVKSEASEENKIFDFLGRVIEITEAEKGMLFTVKDNIIIKRYSRKIFEESWSESKSCNEKIIQSVIADKQGVCLIDWDNVTGYDSVTGMPDWDSEVAVPIINSGEVKGVLCLTSSVKTKEFKFEDLNFVNTLAQLSVAIL